jgi:hypothetical protein
MPACAFGDQILSQLIKMIVRVPPKIFARPHHELDTSKWQENNSAV